MTLLRHRPDRRPGSELRLHHQFALAVDRLDSVAAELDGRTFDRDTTAEQPLKPALLGGTTKPPGSDCEDVWVLFEAWV